MVKELGRRYECYSAEITGNFGEVELLGSYVWVIKVRVRSYFQTPLRFHTALFEKRVYIQNETVTIELIKAIWFELRHI